MSIPAGVSRIVFSGAMPNGEIWSTGFWVLGDTPTSNAQANALAELAWDEFTANDDSGGMFTTFVNLCNGNTTLNKVSAYCYPTGGPTATYVGTFVPGTVLAGSAAGHNPNQVAVVLTLRTGQAGRAYRGRMYLPATGVQMSTDGQLTQAVIADLTNSWALGFTDWNAASDGKIVVVSTSKKGDPSYAGAATAVLSVTMDSRADVQRSRANSEAILRTSIGAVTP